MNPCYIFCVNNKVEDIGASGFMEYMQGVYGPITRFDTRMKKYR